jgi:hypothetical protein
MDDRKLAKGLGWFSIGLGLAEIAAGRQIGRALGMEHRTGLLAAYGAREIATGVGILTASDPTPWMWGRVAGDGLDLATLAGACTEDNPKRGNVLAAIGSIVGITALDAFVAARLQKGRAGSEAFDLFKDRLAEAKGRFGSRA